MPRQETHGAFREVFGVERVFVFAVFTIAGEDFAFGMIVEFATDLYDLRDIGYCDEHLETFWSSLSPIGLVKVHGVGWINCKGKQFGFCVHSQLLVLVKVCRNDIFFVSDI